MEAISLKLPLSILERCEMNARALGLPRAEYIRQAIERMNRDTEAKLRADRLASASRKVRKESMHLNAEFEAIEHDPDA